MTHNDGSQDEPQSLVVSTYSPFVIQYTTDTARLRTFARWPASCPIAAQNLCEAGFYYTGFDDQVRCFYCLGGLSEWVENDNPWEEHARWFPDCSYLINRKGKQYVDEVHERTHDSKKCVGKTKMQHKLEFDNKALFSAQDEMIRICLKLGHSSLSIFAAIVINGGPFKDVTDMINILYSLEEPLPDFQYNAGSVTRSRKRESTRNDAALGYEPLSKITAATPLSEKLDSELYMSDNHIVPPTDIMACIAVQYPETHNLLLSDDLQRQLNTKNPQEFVAYVMKNLSFEQLESLMLDERHRYKTFMAGWPHTSNEYLSGSNMAKAGFYYVGEADRVQCVFCRGSLHQWEADDVPMTEHSNTFTFCRFVRGLECGNITYEIKIKPADLKLVTFFDRNLQEKANNNLGDAEEICEPLAIALSHATHMKYAPESARLRTFTNRSTNFNVSIVELSRAGFFFTGSEDLVRCFYCSGGLRGWSNNDDPWKEHARWFPSCTFLIHQKGHEFVNKIQNDHKNCRTQNFQTDGEPTQHHSGNILSPGDSNKTKEHVKSELPVDLCQLSCKVCDTQTARHIGLPCGHLVFCDDCNEKERKESYADGYRMPDCPKCGASISGTLQFFLA